MMLWDSNNLFLVLDCLVIAGYLLVVSCMDFVMEPLVFLCLGDVFVS
jgi:hypothetical protein